MQHVSFFISIFQLSIKHDLFLYHTSMINNHLAINTTSILVIRHSHIICIGRF